MGHLTENQKELFRKSLDYLTTKEYATLVHWGFFNTNKVVRYCENLEIGMSSKAAFDSANK